MSSGTARPMRRGDPTSHPIIPAPMHFDGVGDDDGGTFAFRSGTTIAYTTSEVAPIVEQFRLEVTRRTGLRLAPRAVQSGPEEPSVTIELATRGEGDKLGELSLPAPLAVSPTGDDPPDERYALAIAGDHVVLRAAEPVGVARGLTTLLQLLAMTPPTTTGEVALPAARIVDGPQYAWRGLSLDVARTFFTSDEVRRVIDLLALYKLNVLHLHLTDDQAWRLLVGRPAERRAPGGNGDGSFYRAEDLRALVAYAADRFVTVIPEVDTPGHTAALVRLHPELDTGRNVFEFELPPGHLHRAAWLDPELPATFALMQDVLAGVATIFPSLYLHIGADEPRGMPHDLYASYVAEVRRRVRSLGKRPLAWQESARAGLGPDDIVQYWFTDIALEAALPPTVRAQMAADLALSRRDLETAEAASVPVIVSPLSHCYFDVPYAERSDDPAQEERQGRVGLHAFYAPMTVAQSFDWEPAEVLGTGRAAQVGGVEAAIWAETIADFDDLSFLLLPRLAGVAHKAWSAPHAATWTDHRDRLAQHGRLWAQVDLTYFRSSSVDWCK